MCEPAMAVAQLETDEHQPENGFVTPETSSPALLSRIDGCVLPFLGGFGKYQKQLIVLTWIPALFIGFSQYSDSFLLAQPNTTCNQSVINGSNLTLTPSSLFNVRNSSGVRAPYILANGTRHNNTDDALCRCTQWKYEMQMGLKENVVTKWNLVCGSKRKVHFAKFSLLVGSIFGYLVMGVLADWFGRHPVLIISVLFMLVFGLTVAFSVNVPMFSTLRFFEGFCLAGISLSLYVLRIELCLPGWRFSMTMVANFVVLGGQLLMPGVAVLCQDWQVLQAVIICPLFFMLSYIWLFPESLRWLLATQQFCRSKWLIARIARKNKANLEKDAEELLTELHQALQKKPKRTCIVKMVGTRNLWKNIVVLCVNSLTGYGIHHCFARSMMYQEAQETTMFHNFYADYYVMAGIAVASCIALCPAVGLMGRRGGLLMFMIITALASLLQLGLLNLLGKYSVQLNIERSDTLKTNFSVAFSIIGMFSSHAVSNLSIFFCAEITPTVIRGGGLGLVLASAGFGMLTAPIMELHDQKGYFLHHVIFACCTLICIICILLLPETRYQPLPETLADGESYTRQPLLPPRKPGEQHFLLTKSESRDYALVHDTPMHEAAATAVSTMDSTASSAVDLTLPFVLSDDDASTRPGEGVTANAATLVASNAVARHTVVEEPVLHNAVPLDVDTATAGSTDEGQASPDVSVARKSPSSSSPAQVQALSPIHLASIEPELPPDCSTPLLKAQTRGAPQPHSPSHPVPDLIAPLAAAPPSPASSVASSTSPARAETLPTADPKVEPPPSTEDDSQQPDLVESLPHRPLAQASHLQAPVTPSEGVLSSTSPSEVLLSPEPPIAEVSSQKTADQCFPEVMETDVSCVNDELQAPAADSGLDSATGLPSSPSPSKNELLHHTSLTDCSTPTIVDVPSGIRADSLLHPSMDNLPPTIPPVSSSPSPPPPSTHCIPPAGAISHSLIDASITPVSSAPCNTAVSPLTLPSQENTLLGVDTLQDSVSPSPSPPSTPYSFSMDCTVSSPIDSGLTAADAATANGVASS